MWHACLTLSDQSNIDGLLSSCHSVYVLCTCVQQAEEERKEAERQAKAAARRAALEVAAARREEDARKRQEFRQETSKVIAVQAGLAEDAEYR